MNESWFYSLCETLPDDERQLMQQLDALILGLLPQISRHRSYGVPFYRARKNICYLWPGGKPWGKSVTYRGVRLGFLRGSELSNSQSLLQQDSRKQVCWCLLTHLNPIIENQLSELLIEAYEMDQLG